MTRNYLEILAGTIRNNWNQPALTDFYLTEDGKAQDTSRGNHYTFGEMYAEIVRVADFLTQLGLQKGDHIAICGANSSHWVIAYLAIAKMQGVSVTVIHSLQLDEIARLIDFSDAKALFVDREIWDELKEQSLSQIENVISLDNWQILHTIITESRQPATVQLTVKANVTTTSNQLRASVSFPQVAYDTLAMICFTSGSTGNPKGVMLSIASISNNVAYKLDVFSHYVGTNVLAILPFAHIYGLVIELLLPLCAGAITNIILSEKLTIKSMFKSSMLLKPKIIFVVPQVIDYIINENIEISQIFDGLDFLSIGGSELTLQAERYLQQNNIGIAIGYGATECGTRITLATANEFKSRSVGKVVDGLILRIAHNGEILVKGENVMLGYYKDPEATAQKIDADGWLHTGDKGHLDEDGYLYVEGRLEQDIIVLPNGENIHPEDIESKINALPEVKESIVFARDGHLVAIVVSQTPLALGEGKGMRLSVLRTINPQLPLYSQLYDVEITDFPLQRTEKQTIKRYLYK